MSSAAGRPRKPTAIKALNGTLRPDRTNPNEPKLDVCLPDRPSWLDEDPLSAQLFDQVTSYMKDMGVGTRVDGLALSLLSDQVALYLRLRKTILNEGELITTQNTNGDPVIKPHPAITPLNQAFANINRLLREYGLTASSRSNLNARTEEPVNTFEDFLNG